MSCDDLVYKTAWTIAVEWSWAKLSENTFASTFAVMGTSRSVVNVCVEQINKRGYVDMLFSESLTDPFGSKKVPK